MPHVSTDIMTLFDLDFPGANFPWDKKVEDGHGQCCL